jgi:putative membrane protein
MQFEFKKLLQTNVGKAVYVATVTLTLSAVGSWAVIAHQDSPAMKADNSKMSAATSKPSMADTHFAKEAAAGGMAEVRMGQLAQEKASSDDVKAFGKRMVEDHTKAGDKLKSVASGENITLPDDISAKDKMTYDHLSKLSGSAFDKAYVNDMVKDHEADVAAFKKEAASGKDDAIKTFASDTLPTLQDHLSKIKDIQKNMGASGSARAAR